MNYDFIRKLAVKVSEQEAGAIIKLLLSHNIETYAEGTSEERKRGSSSTYRDGESDAGILP